jgi:hypothetical protein
LVWIRRDIAFLLEDVVYPPPTSCGRMRPNSGGRISSNRHPPDLL